MAEEPLNRQGGRPAVVRSLAVKVEGRPALMVDGREQTAEVRDGLLRWTRPQR